MQLKSTRGVQQEDVWAAADALIAAGERPTIERVRLKIGRGSPNTVSPMLEAWFATLAPRLGVGAAGSQAMGEGAPKEMHQALDGVWAAAVAAARDKADSELAPERDRLAQQAKELAIARDELTHREAVLTERGVALEHALELAKSQLQDQAAQLTKASRDLERARSSLATLVQERDAERRQFDEQLRTLAQERERLGQRASANERRLLEEVDRARQGAKQSSSALEDARRKHATEKESLDRQRAELGTRLHEGQLELATLKERIQGAEERVKGLESTLAAATLKLQRQAKSLPAKSATRGRRTAGSARRMP